MNQHSPTAAERPHLVIVGTGGRPYREYALATLAAHYRLSAVLAEAPTWQRAYLTAAAVADLSDPNAIVDAVLSLSPDTSRIGLLTWDETVLDATSRAAEKLGLPHASAAATARCRDKYATRSLMAEAGLPAVRHRLVSSAAEAVSAARQLGFPVVLKPRALAGSVGVVRADDPDAVRSAFATATGARFGDLPVGHGVLVEEYLDGDEISVDSVVFEGETRCVHIARKRVGFAPYFEEVGHLVTGRFDAPWADDARELVVASHRVLDVRYGVTHAEVKLTSRGPRLVELNARLGGDLIPYIGWLATGIDLVRAAAEVALGHRPAWTQPRDGAAEVRFVYPPHDGTLRAAGLDEARRIPGIAGVSALAAPGSRLLLPPRQAIPRVAALIAVGADERECGSALDRAQRAVTVEMTADETTHDTTEVTR